jgi:hypothetical protein
MNQLCSQISDRLTDVWEQCSGHDSNMWCDLATDDVAYLEWHKHNDKYVTYEEFGANAMIIFAEFPEINKIYSPFWTINRKRKKQ